MSLRYNDLVSIALFFRLLRRNWLESDLHHDCLLSVCLFCLVSDFSALVSSTEPGRLYTDGAVSPPGPSDLRRASSLTNKHCVGLKEKPPRRCQNKSPRSDKTLEFKTNCALCWLFGTHINITQYLELSKTGNPHFISRFVDSTIYLTFIMKASARYGSAFRVLFKAASLFLNHVPNTIIRKCRDVSNSQPATRLQ